MTVSVRFKFYHISEIRLGLYLSVQCGIWKSSSVYNRGEILPQSNLNLSSRWKGKSGVWTRTSLPINWVWLNICFLLCKKMDTPTNCMLILVETRIFFYHFLLLLLLFKEVCDPRKEFKSAPILTAFLHRNLSSKRARGKFFQGKEWKVVSSQ